jgi:hypothetical protein
VPCSSWRTSRDCARTESGTRQTNSTGKDTHDAPPQPWDVQDHLLGWLLPDGGPVSSLAQEDVERFCWYKLPVKWRAEPAEYPSILTALTGLLNDAGRPRAAAICTSQATGEVLAAWQRSPDQGRAAFQRAVDASPVTPPDTALLT